LPTLAITSPKKLDDNDLTFFLLIFCGGFLALDFPFSRQAKAVIENYYCNSSLHAVA
jgi:hypothetical protein